MKKTYVASLSIGRCFTHAEEANVEELDGRVVGARTIMTPEATWKVTQPDDGEHVTAENARGEARQFARAVLVQELPREGFDRLVQRCNDPDDPLGQR